MADKVVIRAEDFVSWIVEDMQWNWGLLASYNDKATSPPKLISTSNGLTTNTLLSSTRLDLSEIEKEKFSGKFQIVVGWFLVMRKV